jgi:hypothetical protein
MIGDEWQQATKSCILHFICQHRFELCNVVYTFIEALLYSVAIC